MARPSALSPGSRKELRQAIHAMPVSDYLHDGVYIVVSMGYPVPYRFDSGPGGLELIRDNKLCPKSYPVSLEWAREHVLGLVVGHVRLPSSVREAHGWRGRP